MFFGGSLARKLLVLCKQHHQKIFLYCAQLNYFIEKRFFHNNIQTKMVWITKYDKQDYEVAPKSYVNQNIFKNSLF